MPINFKSIQDMTIKRKFRMLAWIVGGVLISAMFISLVSNQVLINANNRIYLESTRAIEAVSGIQHDLSEARDSEVLAVSYSAVVNVEKLTQLEKGMAARKEKLLAKLALLNIDDRMRINIKDIVNNYFESSLRTFEHAKRYVTDEASKNVTENSWVYYGQLDVLLNNLMDEKVKEAAEQNRKSGIYAMISMLMLAAATLVAVALIYFLRYFSRSVVEPIHEMSGFVQKISRGDLNQTVMIQSKDEIGDMGNALNEMNAYLRDMARVAEEIAEGNLKNEVTPKSEQDVLGNSFRRMTEGLRKLINEIRTGSEHLAAAATQIALSSEQTSKNSETSASAVEEMTATMHEMSANMQSVANNTQKQAMSVSDTSSSIEQMMVSIQNVAEYVKELISIAQKTSDAVGKGTDAVHNASTGMNEINNAIVKSEQTITSLGSKTEDMSRIVEVIDDISEQTNLLALNAAIEAARAGEQGLGFAVVADEVRKLAERSAHSTREIAELIQSIARESKSAVENMNMSTALVHRGLQFTQEVITSLDGIRKTVEDLSRFTKEIGKSTQEQSQGSDQIRKTVISFNDAIHDISSASEQQSLGANQVVQGIERIQDMVQQSASGAVELATSAELLNQQANNLKALVEKFALDGQVMPKIRLAKAA